jgi:hypothetical protein
LAFIFIPTAMPCYSLIVVFFLSQSHEINQIAQSVGNLQFRSFTGESNDSVMTSSQDPSAGRRRWEYGQIDYAGIDSFENIQRRLDETLLN